MRTNPPYINALTELDPPYESIRMVSKQIHRTESRLWQLKKAINKEPPFCVVFKNKDLAEEIITAKEKARKLHAVREKLKAETPKDQWYPRRKYQGRYNNRENEIKTQIMKDCFRYGWNVKQIAGYFNLTLAPVYKRIKVKLKKEL